MNKHPRAPLKVRKRAPGASASPTAHRTNGYSMPCHVHATVAAIAESLGKTKGSVLAKLVADANPEAMVGYPPVVHRPLPKRHGKKRAATPSSKKRTLTLPVESSDRLDAYAAFIDHLPGRVLASLIEEHLPNAKSLQAAAQLQQRGARTAKAAGKKP